MPSDTTKWSQEYYICQHIPERLLSCQRYSVPFDWHDTTPHPEKREIHIIIQGEGASTSIHRGQSGRGGWGRVAEWGRVGEAERQSGTPL